MPTHHALVLLLIQLALLLLPSFGLYGLFKKAGAPAWTAFVPFYNTWVMQELGERPKHWVFWQLIPIVGWFITMSICVEFVKSFGKFSLWEHALAALLPVLYFTWLAYDPKVKFLGPESVRRHRKGKAREWVDAGVFAVVAATLIRTFVFEAYVIPSGSMEKTLLVNDYLFVSKFAYGPRLPMTPLSFPFVHNSLPFSERKSYIEWPTVPYIRWFASPVKRGDVVVFNHPVGDTVINTEAYGSLVTYYDAIRTMGNGNVDSGRQLVLSHPDEYPLIIRPVDKEENYIKRCVGIPGDTLTIKDHVVYIDGQAQPFPPESETFYTVRTKVQSLDETVLKEKYDVDMTKDDDYRPNNKPNEYRMLLTNRGYQQLVKDGIADSIGIETDSSSKVFPYSPLLHWNIDNYGPIFLPNKGATITLTPENYAVYERVIKVYEGNDFAMHDGKFFLNGQQVTQYTFKNNYYWMMGDNRHDSQDSRLWGFVPEDHIVGKASLIWMSWEKGVRWRRLFRKIN